MFPSAPTKWDVLLRRRSPRECGMCYCPSAYLPLHVGLISLSLRCWSPDINKLFSFQTLSNLHILFWSLYEDKLTNAHNTFVENQLKLVILKGKISFIRCLNIIIVVNQCNRDTMLLLNQQRHWFQHHYWYWKIWLALPVLQYLLLTFFTFVSIKN